MPGQTLDVAPAIARALLERGVASLRFDKRGVGKSEGEYLLTGFHAETSDAGDALAYLRSRPEVDPGRLAVIGHSVGATIAVRLASGDPAVAAVVLLAGAAVSGEEVMRRQSQRVVESLRGPLRLAAPLWLRRQARVRRRLLESRDDVVREGRQRLPGQWFREYMRYDPAADLAAVRCPVLAITGGHDIQVDAADLDRIGSAVRGPFTAVAPPTLTHLLRTHPRPGLAGYRAQLKQPMDPDVLATIAAWVADATGKIQA